MKNRLGFLIILTLILLNLNFLIQYKKNKEELFNRKSDINKENNLSHLKKAGYWDLTGSPIFIDDTAPYELGSITWTQAVLENWCSGSGTWVDPYRIENVTINNSGIQINCIEVRDSNVYFIIKNCTLYAPVGNSAGIKLVNINNATLKENDCFQSYYKIWCVNCYNNTILKNKANNEPFGMSGNGIRLENSENNSIIDNDVNNNRKHGIYLENCRYNIIDNNIVNSNDGSGIFLKNSHNNLIKSNFLESTDAGSGYLGSGIILENADNNTIFSNTAWMDDCASMEIINSMFNNVSGNYFGEGIRIRGNLLELSSHIIDNSNRVYSNEYIYYFINKTGLSSETFINPGQIILINCNNSNISNINFIHSCVEPISLHYLNNNSITNINTSNQRNGVFLSYCQDTVVRDCNIKNGDDIGILLENCDNSTILLNKVNNNNKEGIALYYNCNNNTISYNKASYNYPSGGYVYYGIRLSDNCHNNTVSHNIVYGNGFGGIGLYGGSGDCRNNTIYNNTIYNNDYVGIRIEYCHHNSIINNEVYDTGINQQNYGIYIFESDNNNISKNIVKNHTIDGILLMQSSSHNLLSENVVNGSVQNGIILKSASPFCHNNKIWNNKITNNGVSGLCIQKGSNNLVYNNSFENPAGINAIDDSTNNDWNYINIGNYWADYSDNDADDDGIGDSPYKINGTAGSQDNYPLWEDTNDPPFIIINSPINNSVFGEMAPNFNIHIADLKLNTSWYTLDGGNTNFTITGFNGFINQSAWNELTDGLLSLKFYANDSMGNDGVSEVSICKDTNAPIIIFEFSEFYLNTTKPEYFHDGLVINCTINDISSLNWVYLCENSTGVWVNRSMINLGDGNWTSSIDISVLNLNDMIAFSFYANDSCGNIGKKDNNSLLYLINIKDLQPPTSLLSFISYLVQNQVNKSTIFTIIADDGQGSDNCIIYYRINKSEWIAYTSPFSLLNYDTAMYLIEYYAVDDVGNVESTHSILITLVRIQAGGIPSELIIVSSIIIGLVGATITAIVIKRGKGRISKAANNKVYSQ